MRDIELIANGMERIARAFRPVSRIEQGSRKWTPMGTAIVVAGTDQVFLITADHVLDGYEGKMVGANEAGSVRWPLKFSRLKPLMQDLPDADLAWFTVTSPSDIQTVGEAIPFSLASATVIPAPGPAYLAVGHPSSKAKMLDAHSVLASKLMMVSVSVASEAVTAALKLDHRVQLAFTHSSPTMRGTDGRPIVPARAQGMSGGAIVATTRSTNEHGEEEMIPYLVGVLTHFSELHKTYIATKLEHFWTTQSVGPEISGPLYNAAVGSLRDV